MEYGSPSLRSDCPFNGCQWLVHPEFRYGDLSHWPEDGRANLHLAFRTSFILPRTEPATIRLTIAADDLFKVWIDGEMLGAGPAACGTNPCYYNVFETKLDPVAGHTLAIQVYYHGSQMRMHTSGDGRVGFVARLEIQTDTGWEDVCVSNAGWRCRRLRSRSSNGRMFGYRTQHAEDIDLRLDEPGWTGKGFDDSAWVRAEAIAVPADYHFAPQHSSPVVYFRADPVSVRQTGAGRFLIDFGQEIVGETCFRVTGPAGHQIEVRHGEELATRDEVRFEMRCNCKYQEWITLAGRQPDHAEFFDYKGFRYVEILNWPEPDIAGKVWVRRREAPWPHDATTFVAPDPDVQAVWQICVNAIRVGTQERYLDCPTREKIAFLGDALVTGHSHLLLTADPRPYQQLWEDFKVNHDECPLIGAHGGLPGSEILVEYGLLIPEMLLTYYTLTGDLSPLIDWAPRVRSMLDAYSLYEDEQTGLITDVHRPRGTMRAATPLVDWPDNLRDGYDDPSLLGRKPTDADRNIANTVVNLRYAAAWRDYGKVLALVGGASENASARATMLRETCRGMLRGDDGLFVDRHGSEHRSFHANIVALDTDAAEGGDIPAIIGLVQGKGLACGVWFAHFVLRSLAAHGRADLAYQLLTDRGERGWINMLASGATTCMEAWGPGQKWNTSWCHPWASAPIPFIVEHMMGIHWDVPGQPRRGERKFVPEGWEGARLNLKWAGGQMLVE